MLATFFSGFISKQKFNVLYSNSGLIVDLKILWNPVITYMNSMSVVPVLGFRRVVSCCPPLDSYVLLMLHCKSIITTGPLVIMMDNLYSQ